MNITVVRSHGCRCSISWPVGKPTAAGASPHWLGVHRHTLGHWLALYEAGGLTALLEVSGPAGQPISLPPQRLVGLEQALRRPAGCASYEALRQWVKQTDRVEVNYHTLYPIVRTRFTATLQVPRPSHTKKS